jgi:hypothetical protein
MGLSHSGRENFGKYVPGVVQTVLNSDEYRDAVAPDKEVCPSCRYNNLCFESGMIRPPAGYRDMNFKVPYCRRVLEKIFLSKEQPKVTS